MYWTLRIDADPISWQLTEALERVPALDAPVVLPVYHPLKGELILSPRSMGSAVFLEYKLPDVDGTRPNGYPIPGAAALYLPSPTGPAPHMVPPNIYLVAGTVDSAALKADIITAMERETRLPVKLAQGEVVINGAAVPFAILCPENP